MFGNCFDRGVGALDGSLRMKRRAFSDVTKSRSESGSFPSFSQMSVSCRRQRGMRSGEECVSQVHKASASVGLERDINIPDQYNHHQGSMACVE